MTGTEVTVNSSNTVNLGGERVQFTVNGITTDDFSLPNNEMGDPKAVAMQLQLRINDALRSKIESDKSASGKKASVTVSWDTTGNNGRGKFRIMSQQTGSNTSVTVTKMSSSLKTKLGLTSPTTATGSDAGTSYTIPANLKPFKISVNGTEVDVTLPGGTNIANRGALATALQNAINTKLTAATSSGTAPQVEVEWNTQYSRYIFKSTLKSEQSQIAFKQVDDTRWSRLLGFKLPKPEIGADPKTFRVEVDGVSSGLIRLPMGEYTDGHKFAQAVQQAINMDSLLVVEKKGVTVTFENGKLRIASNAVGNNTRVLVTGGAEDTLLKLGFAEKNPPVYGSDATSAKSATPGYMESEIMRPAPSEIKVGFGEQTLSLSVDGVDSGTITLPLMVAYSQSPDDFARTLQTKINADPTLRSARKSVGVSWTGTQFIFVSTTSGSDSSVKLKSMADGLRPKIGMVNPVSKNGVAAVSAKQATSAQMVSDKLEHTEPATSAQLTLGPVTISGAKPITLDDKDRDMQIRVNDHVLSIKLDAGPFSSHGKLATMIKSKINAALTAGGHTDRIDSEIIGNKIILKSEKSGVSSRLEMFNMPAGLVKIGFKSQDGFKSKELDISNDKKLKIENGQNVFSLSHKGQKIGPVTIPAKEYESGQALAKAVNTALSGKSGGGRSVTVSWNESSKRLVWNLSGTGADSQLSVMDMPYELRKKIGMIGVPEYVGSAESSMKEEWTSPANLKTFNMTVDGIATGDLTFPSAKYTSPKVMATKLQETVNASSALQSAGKSITVTWNSKEGRFFIKTAGTGKASSLEIKSMDARMMEKIWFLYTAGQVWQRY